jgi:hypothetical protein
MPNQKPSDPKTEIIRLGVLLVGIVIVMILIKLGAFKAIGSSVVNYSIKTQQAEVERQQNQPRTMVFKSGERRKVKRVLDSGKYWGFILLDGRSGVCPKEDVVEIVDESVK